MFSSRKCDEAIKKAEANLGFVRVLIAEDSRLNQKIAQKFFERAGIDKDNITVVGNGKLAVDHVAEHHDGSGLLVIYMDHEMPVMMGDVAISKIREIEADKDLANSYIFTCSATAGAKLAGSDTQVPKRLCHESVGRVLQEAQALYEQRGSSPSILKKAS